MSPESFQAFNLETNPYSLLVIDKNMKLRRIYCPFYAKAMISSARFALGEIVKVSKVLAAETDKLVFEIYGLRYSSSCFRII